MNISVKKSQKQRKEEARLAAASVAAAPASSGFNQNASVFVPGSLKSMGGGLASSSVSDLSDATTMASESTSGSAMKKVGSLNALLGLENGENGVDQYMDMDEEKRLTSIDDLAAAVEACSLMDFELGHPSSARAAIASDMFDIVERCGFTSDEGAKVLEVMSSHVQASTPAREAGLLLMQRCVKRYGRTMEPYVLPLLSTVMLHHGDRSPVVRGIAADLVAAVADILSVRSFRLVFPIIAEALEHDDWRIRVGGLAILEKVSPRMPVHVSPMLPLLIPLATECIISTKKQVQTAGVAALQKACASITNEDIAPLVPKLVSVIANPDEIPSTLDALLETVFVATVDAPTLSLIAPLLVKVLRGKKSVMKRKASRVVDNMCRLVTNPCDVAPFEPMLLPALERVIDEIADEEVAGVAREAKVVLMKALGDAVGTDVAVATSEVAKASPVGLKVDEVGAGLLSSFYKALPQAVANKNCAKLVKYMATTAAHLISYETPKNPSSSSTKDWRAQLAMTNVVDWEDCITPYVEVFTEGERTVDTTAVPSDGDTIDGTVSELVRKVALDGEPDMIKSDNGDYNYVCNFEFSLAYGGKILLHSTQLKLGVGRRYGIMGKNGVGKTTLLTNIANCNIEGLPPHLKCVYVQHEDTRPDHGVPLLDEVAAGSDMVEAKVSKQDVEKALHDVDFTDTMLSQPRSSLSGGWKMKVIIIRAILSKADILLLDEPTNHLDAASVQWLVDTLNAAVGVTSMIVTHDTSFMDKVVTDVIHYEEKKLVYYKGTLQDFVAIKPEARYYYELEESTLRFKFPTPERLDGINSTTKSILRMEDASYTYPKNDKPTIMNANVKVCLSSRIGILGANGAGKSTLIKMMVQETVPDEGSGELWKHHNLRIAYVAQHSFHHVEKHLDESPVDYIKWRFGAPGGVDRESVEHLAVEELKSTVADENAGRYGFINDVIGRRKNGRTLEYECTFYGQTKEPNKYIAMEELLAMGPQYEKLIELADARIAAMAAGLDLRPLVNKEIQGHLDDYNLEAEFGTHSKIRRLSGGQKVKLVLAAAMWNKPHLLVLDEPTNYLDRQAMGALTLAIKDYGGGVVIISHNKEFTDALCTETWTVAGGRVSVEGEAGEADMKASSSRRKKESAKRSNNHKEATNEENRTGGSVGNVNATIEQSDLINPKTYEKLSKKEIRKLEKCAAGVPLREYLSKIDKHSPEWKWLGKG